MPTMIDKFRNLSSGEKAAISLAFATLLAHCATLLIYAENIPIGDDYWDVLRFLYQYESSTSIKDKALTIWIQHNEHRTAFGRIIYLAMYELYGAINFKALMLIGDLSTIGIIVLLAHQYRAHRHNVIIWAFVAIFLLGLQSWESMLWAMTAISNYSVVFFSLACFISATTNKTTRVFAAMLFAACASLSMGNGLLTWPLGLLCILLSNPTKRKLHIALWLLATLIFIYIYLHDYKSTEAMQIHRRLQPHQWLDIAHWILAFLGGSWTFESTNSTAATIAGCLLVTINGLFFIRLTRTSPAIASFIAFIVLSAAITAGSRFFWGPEMALESRYKIYSVYFSCLALINSFLWLSERAPNFRAWGHALIAISVMHTAATYATSLPPMRTEQRDAEDSMRRWLLTGKGYRYEFYFMPDSGTWIEDSIVSKRWDSRPLFTDSLYFRSKKHVSICAENQFADELSVTIRRTPEAIAGEILIDDRDQESERARHIIVCQDQRAYTAAVTNPSRNHEGKLLLHYLKTDPIENTDTIIIESQTGKRYKARLLQQ